MVRSLFFRLPIWLLLLAWPLPGRTYAQQAGAAITFPRQGQPIQGTLAITGTAVHPALDRYELAFAYEPNPLGTWFPIGEPVRSAVVDGNLAVWDVSGITDGSYTLRLRVYGQDGAAVEAVVTGVLVQNTPPTSTPPPASSTPAITVTPAPAGTSTPLVEQPPTTTPRPPGAGPGDGGPGGEFLNGQQVQGAFWAGVRLAFVLFLILGVYAGLRAALRPRLYRWLRQVLQGRQR